MTLTFDLEVSKINGHEISARPTSEQIWKKIEPVVFAESCTQPQVLTYKQINGTE